MFVLLLYMISNCQCASTVQGAEEKDERAVEDCEGIGEDECLMRRTLTAHTDYIYTQKHH